MIVTAGSTNISVYYYIVQDASATSPGEPVTGLLFSDIETGGSASYARQGAIRTDLTLITLASASATHADGGFILVDDTNMPGLYRCDYPDAAFATGVDQVMLQIVVASGKNAVASPIFVDITDVDLRDGVRGGMTALPNAAADAAGGLPISDAGGLALDTQLANTDQITVARMGALTDWINGGRLDLILDIIAADTTTDIPALINALNDIAATDIVSAGAITTLTGAVVNVDLVDTLTTYTGNTPQTADHTAAIADIPTVSEFNARTILAANYALEASIAALNDLSKADLQTTALTESYAAKGVAPTQNQILYMLLSLLSNRAISGTVMTADKIDGATASSTYTLDSSTAPTSQTRAT